MLSWFSDKKTSLYKSGFLLSIILLYFYSPFGSQQAFSQNLISKQWDDSLVRLREFVED